MKERLFRFKQFSVQHSLSAMKIGVDGVLLGAWANIEGDYVLDVGTGCGLIALMAAQRNNHAVIKGIDIDAAAVAEASLNFDHSPWSNRLEAREISYIQAVETQPFFGIRFDHIISNPPFFDAGLTDPCTMREKSRHSASLSPQVILSHAPKLLSESGMVSLITPASCLSSLVMTAHNAGLHCRRLTLVATVEGKRPKRLLSEWCRNPCEKSENIMYIETGEYPHRNFSPEYKALCSPFYLKM